VPKQRALNYQDELEHQRRAWERKPALRSVYRTWFARIRAELAPVGPTVEIGAGSGNFKEFLPEVIATDVFDNGPWLDVLADARRLPFGDGDVGNVVMADAIHHMPRPLDVLREVRRVLRPGGRVVILEPAATPWARLVLRLFHHEPVDLHQDVFAEDGSPEPANEGFSFANQAFATLLFVDNPHETLQRVEGLELKSVQRSDFIVYPATGGFSYFCLVPANLAEPLQRAETRLLSRTTKLTAMRLLIVLERSGEARDRS
jgi:SAM-dependent methyltransferase